MTGATETVLMGLGIVSVPTILEAPAALIRFSAPSASTGWVQSTKIRLAPFFLQALAASAMVPPVLMMSSAKTMSRPFTSTLPVSISSLDFVSPSLRTRLLVNAVCSASSSFATVPAHCSASSSGPTTMGFFGLRFSRAYLPRRVIAETFWAGILKTLETSPSRWRWQSIVMMDVVPAASKNFASEAELRASPG